MTSKWDVRLMKHSQQTEQHREIELNEICVHDVQYMYACLSPAHYSISLARKWMPLTSHTNPENPSCLPFLSLSLPLSLSQFGNSETPSTPWSLQYVFSLSDSEGDWKCMCGGRGHFSHNSPTHLSVTPHRCLKWYDPRVRCDWTTYT